MFGLSQTVQSTWCLYVQVFALFGMRLMHNMCAVNTAVTNKLKSSASVGHT